MKVLLTTVALVTSCCLMCACSPETPEATEPAAQQTATQQATQQQTATTDAAKTAEGEQDMTVTSPESGSGQYNTSTPGSNAAKTISPATQY